MFSDDAQSPNNEPSNFFAYDFKRKIARSEFFALPATIAVDWSIFLLTTAGRPTPADSRKTVTGLYTT
jgi:hypothetical protein